MRKLMIKMILATDMTCHFGLKEELDGVVMRNSDLEKEQEEALELENNQEDSEQPIVESKPKIKKKSFFDKFTDGLKEFLDNAE